MAETTADVRRDIEMTRERISTTLAQLEQKTNVAQIVRDHPWPALAAAVGVGVLLSGSKADIKAAGATVAATKGASSKLGGVLDEALANLMGGVHQAFQGHVDSIVEDLKKALGAQNLGNAGGNAGRGGARGGSVSDKVAKLMSSAGADAASDSSRGSSQAFAGSGASGSPMTATPTSGTMTTGSGASGTSSGGGSWAPQTPDAVSAASVVNSTSPNTARAD
jgi:hypothetical protein